MGCEEIRKACKYGFDDLNELTCSCEKLRALYKKILSDSEDVRTAKRILDIGESKLGSKIPPETCPAEEMYNYLKGLVPGYCSKEAAKLDEIMGYKCPLKKVEPKIEELTSEPKEFIEELKKEMNGNGNKKKLEDGEH